MSFEYDPPTGLLDTSVYPDVPASPTAARQQFMDLFYQARDQIGILLKYEKNIWDFSDQVLNLGLSNEDWSPAFTAAINYVKAQASSQRLAFPAGIYKYSTSPNWAVQDLEVIAYGEVRLRYTGTGNAVILDGIVGTNSNVYNMKFGRFIVEAPSTAQDAVYVKCVHHSEIDVKVLGAGTNYAGFHLLFSVCNTIKLTVSNNEEGWYLGATPKYGIQLGKLIVGQLPSYNTFINPIIEGTIEGSYIDDSLGNIFIGGTMEGCADNGLWLTANAGLNKFFGTDFEANAGMDVYCLGFENEFHGIDSTKIVDFGATAKNNNLMGGSFKNITLESGSARNLVSGVKYNRELFDGTTGTITDSGVNRVVDNMNVKLNKIENRAAAVTTITVGISPYTYANTSGNDERILVKNGTITELFLNHGGAGDVISSTTQFVTLCPGDELVVTYSVAPTMRKYTT